jgi:hypothetical protein
VIIIEILFGSGWLLLNKIPLLIYGLRLCSENVGTNFGLRLKYFSSEHFQFFFKIVKKN